MFNLIAIRKDVPSGTIILQQPQTRNALGREAVAQLQQAILDFQAEKNVRAIILTASGDAFSSGTDLREMKETLDSADAEHQWQQDVEGFLSLLETMLRCPKPIVAAVNGGAVGSGAALLLAADVVVAGPTAYVSFPEPQRGLVAGLAAPLLAFRIGAGRASRLILSTRTANCRECLDMGIFHESVPAELLWARAHEVCKDIALGSHQSIMLSKQLINETIGEQLFTQLSIGAAHTASARTTEAAREGIEAFLEKRKSSFN